LNYLCLAGEKILSNIFGSNKYEITSLGVFSSLDLKVIKKINPDIINIHWACGGFLNLSKIEKIKKPIVWTMHDMWAFSGFNHYNLNKDNYITGDFSDSSYLDKFLWKKKVDFFKENKDIIFVSPSKWLQGKAKKSIALRDCIVKNIPNGVDVSVFNNNGDDYLRNKFGISQDKKIVLFGAVNPFSGKRKGYEILIEVIKKIKSLNKDDDLVLVVFGSDKIEGVKFNIPTYFTGNISSEVDMANIYSGADIFIMPSMEDNLPNTVLESMSCETPVVAFNIGGMSDMIDDNINGLLVEPFNASAMAEEILLLLKDDDRLSRMSEMSRKKMINYFNPKNVSIKYIELYKDILK